MTRADIARRDRDHWGYRLDPEQTTSGAAAIHDRRELLRFTCLCEGDGYYLVTDFTGTEVIECGCDPVPAGLIERLQKAVAA